MSKTTTRQPHQFQPGDVAIWWKRIPGGPYVYPIKVTVLAITPKGSSWPATTMVHM